MTIWFMGMLISFEFYVVTKYLFLKAGYIFTLEDVKVLKQWPICCLLVFLNNFSSFPLFHIRKFIVQQTNFAVHICLNVSVEFKMEQ